MLTSVLGVLLAASLGAGPHAPAPEDVCLMEERCARDPVYCLVGGERCPRSVEGRICFATRCAERGPEMPPLQP